MYVKIKNKVKRIDYNEPKRMEIEYYICDHLISSNISIMLQAS